jgi:rhodanese-related sulfurtransferase
VTRLHFALGVVASVLGMAAPLARSSSAEVEVLAKEIASEQDHLSALELAERLMRGDALRVFDLRSEAEFNELHIPTAQLASIDSLMEQDLPRDTTLVLYSEGGTHAAQAWVLMRLRGYRHVFVLREGMYEWVSRVRDPRLAVDATPAERTEFERAATYSRFFGGTPVAGVARADVAVGYWSAAPRPTAERPSPAARPIRRRGC